MTDLSSIRAVTFDVGGTLIEPWPSVGHVYAAVAAEHGMSGLDPQRLNRQFAAAWKSKGQFNYSKAAWAKLVAKTFHGPVEPCPEVSFFEVLYERFTGPDVWKIHEDVVPAFEALLQRDIKLAAVSNWDERLRPLLKNLKLDGYFDTVAISSEIGFEKPSPVIFEEALRKLGVRASQVLHVGDSVREDVDGARAAGFEAVLIRRGVKEPQDDEITSLRNLDVLIR